MRDTPARILDRTTYNQVVNKSRQLRGAEKIEFGVDAGSRATKIGPLPMEIDRYVRIIWPSLRAPKIDCLLPHE